MRLLLIFCLMTLLAAVLGWLGAVLGAEAGGVLLLAGLGFLGRAGRRRSRSLNDRARPR